MLGLAQFTRALPRLGTTIRRLEDRRALEADILESEIISDVLKYFSTCQYQDYHSTYIRIKHNQISQLTDENTFFQYLMISSQQSCQHDSLFTLQHKCLKLKQKFF